MISTGTLSSACSQRVEHPRGQVTGAERDDRRTVAVGAGGSQQGAVVAQRGGHDRDPPRELMGPDRRRPQRLGVEPHAALDDPSERSCGGRAERRRAGAVDLVDDHRAVDLASERDHDAEPLRLRRTGQRQRVEQVGGPVGARVAGRAVGSGQHDRRLAAVDHRAQDRELLERVGAGRDDHALAGVGRFAGAVGERQRLLERDLCARQRQHVLGLEPRDDRQLRQLPRAAGRR